jgi:ribosomal protein S18 acetylase RimI-like enzyme
MEVTYRFDLEKIDWRELKTALAVDGFGNGRTPEQLERSFRNSHSTCIAQVGQRIVCTARILSDGICNAYLIDVWTLSEFRDRGIARRMVDSLLEKLQGQHVYLQCEDDAVEFYKKLGFGEQPHGLSLIVGKWLADG